MQHQTQKLVFDPLWTSPFQTSTSGRP